jgi:DNA polymerase type B, organellar and viral
LTYKPTVKRLPKMYRNRRFLIGSFDCETIGLDGALSVWTLAHETWGAEAFVFDTFAQVLEKILTLNPALLSRTRWYAWNAEYDWRYAVDAFEFYRKRFEFIPKERMEGKLYAIEIQDKTGEKVTEFFDAMALFPGTLAEFTKQFAPNLPKLDFDHSIIFDKTNPEHIRYAKRDVESLIVALDNFDKKVYEVFGVHLRGTISSTALQACLRFLPEGKFHDRICSGPEAFIRKTYVGGLVRINAKRGKVYANVNVVDFNSRYPASMRLGVPCGKIRRTYEFAVGQPGFYRVIATVPETETFPVVPYRDKYGAVSFPVGRFECYTTSVEINEGISRGYQFEVLEGYVFSAIEYPFDEFVDVCEKMRGEYKGTATETVVKLIQNSVYGKFGTKPEGRELKILFSDEDVPEGYYTVYDDDEEQYVTTYCWRECERSAPYMLPHWASTITANSRLALFNLFGQVGEENVYYADTDSAHLSAAVDLLNISHMISSKYGDLKLEKTLPEVKYWVPKGYTYMDKDGKLAATYKGIPKGELKKEANLVALHSTGALMVTFHSSASFQSYLRTRKLSNERTRNATDPEKVKSHRLDEKGHWRPPIKKS